MLTACGIETLPDLWFLTVSALQQCLPLAVLKHDGNPIDKDLVMKVATVLTACGIETVLILIVRKVSR